MDLPQHLQQHDALGIPDNIGIFLAAKPRTIAYIGDSITAMPILRFTCASSPATWLYVYGSKGSAQTAGTGSFDYRASDGKMRWTAPGDTAGAYTTLVAGINKLQSGSANKEILIGLKPLDAPSIDTTYSAVLADGQENSYSQHSYWYNAQNSSGHCFDLVTVLGVPVDTSTQVLARMSQLYEIDAYGDPISEFPHVVVLLIGTNDICNDSETSQTVNDNIDTFVSHVTSRGSIPVIVNILARNSLLSAQFIKFQEVGFHLQELSRSNKAITIFDGFAATRDPAVTTGAMISTYTADGVHLNGVGSVSMGRKVGAALVALNNGILGRSTCQIAGARYNRVVNSAFIGTAGTAGTGASGTVPTSWTVKRTGATLTITSAVVAVANELPWLSMTCAGATLYDSCQAYMTANLAPDSNLAAGDLCYADCEIDFSGVTGLINFECYIYCANGAVQKTIRAGKTFGTGDMGVTSIAQVLRTPTERLFSDTIYYNFYFMAQFAAGGGGVIKMRAPNIKKVG